MRLDKYLADMNIGTRTELKKAIRKGSVKIDGAVVKDPGYALSGNEEVYFQGKKVAYEKASYYMMNKPSGVICATEDKHQQTVLDLMEKERRRDLFPIGRLDKDTVGLVFLSNDGEMAHRLLSPKFHVDKVYEARVDGHVTEEDVKQFAKGIRYDEDLVAAPAYLEILGYAKEEIEEILETEETADDNGESLEIGEMVPTVKLRMAEVTDVRVTIHEGKFHQIKKMFVAVEKPVLHLKRVSIGPLVLDEYLEEGEYRRLTEEELAAVKQAAKMD